MHDQQNPGTDTDTDPVPLALALGNRPAHWPAYAAAGVPLMTVAGPMADLGQIGPVLLVGVAGAAVAGAAWRYIGSGRQQRRRRGFSMSPRTRARLRMRPGYGFATRGQLYRHYGRLPARRLAKWGRPSLTTRDRWLGPWREYATYHGRAQGLLHRWGVYSSFEDPVLCIAPAQEGKSQKAAASIIDAPGPLAVTSIRGDLIRDTVGLRQQHGYTYIFNPEGVGLYRSNMRWNPVSGCQDIVTAVRRAGYMVEASEARGLSDAVFWQDIGTMTLASFMHAAALMGGNLRHVYQWVSSPEDADHALYVLTEHRQASEIAAETLRRLAAMTEKTRDGVITTLSRVLRFLIDPGVVEALCPSVGSAGEFDFVSFLRSRDTVYLVASAEEGGSTTAPVFSAFLAELAATATALGNRYEGEDGQEQRRLDPPLTIEGDELANTAPVPLDKWVSWAAGSGIRLHMYFQSWARIQERWGKEGAESLWTNAKCKIIGSGVTEEAVLSRMSRLIGKIDVREKDEITHDRAGNQIRRPRFAEVDIISAAEIRRIPRGKALVLRSAAAAPTMITLDTLRTRRQYKQWVKAGASVEGLYPIQQREIPTVRPELANPWTSPQPAQVDEISAWRARRDPSTAPPLPLPGAPADATASDSGARPAPPPSWGRAAAVDVPAAPEPEPEADEATEVPQGWTPWQRRSGSA